MNTLIKLNKAQYLKSDQIIISIDLKQKPQNEVKVFIYQLQEKIPFQYQSEEKDHLLLLTISPLPIGNYGVVVIVDEATFNTAFDVVNNYREIVRYGFLSDFSLKDDDTLDIENLKDLHINAIQFYDWMYRHDQLVSIEQEYLDPLGRSTSLDTIRKKIEACKEAGIRPFAYGAVYAAGSKLFEKHPEWGLYHTDGLPILFADWLHFMNISPDCGWSEYIINQFREAMEKLGFMGIHMDTYGFPKSACDAKGHSFSLADAFPSLINKASSVARNINPQNGVIFNAVNNWPMEAVANTNQDAIYIEVWQPHETYFELYRLIREAKMLGKKNVILAAYMKPFKEAKTEEDLEKAETALLLTNAVINASGGTQLIFGENEGILCDSYYVNYAKMRKEFKTAVQNYSNYLVRYADLLYNDSGVDISMTATSGINEDIYLESRKTTFSSNGKENTVWNIVRESSNRITIQLINLNQNDSVWNAFKLVPQAIDDITIRFRLDRRVKGIWLASPDHYMNATQLSYKSENGSIIVKVPELRIWSTIWVEME